MYTSSALVLALLVNLGQLSFSMGDVCLTVHNNARTAKNLPILIRDPNLETVAKEHNIVMGGACCLANECTGENSLSDRVAQYGNTYISVGGNVAAGIKNCTDAVAIWMDPANADGANVLGNYTHLGCAMKFQSSTPPCKARTYFTCIYAEAKPVLLPTGNECLTELNTARQSKGKTALVWNPMLEQAALNHQTFLGPKCFDNRCFSSYPFEEEFGDRVRTVGYYWSSIAENIGTGSQDCASTVASWMKPGGTQQNIVGDYNDVGCAVKPCSLPGDKNCPGQGQYYRTCVFGKPDVSVILPSWCRGSLDSCYEVNTAIMPNAIKITRTSTLN